MIQVSLFCPHCCVKLELKEYRELLAAGTILMGCYWCGRSFLNYDIDEPKYIKGLLTKVELDKKIRALCAITGKQIDFIEDFVRRNNLSVNDLDDLIHAAAEKGWNFDD